MVPSLWQLEVGDAVHHRRCDEAYADRGLGRLSDLKIQIDDETDNRAWGTTGDLARIEGLAPYDAAYPRTRPPSAAAARRKVETLPG